MKVLKKKFRKIIKKAPEIFKLKPIIIKPKLGRWCKYYEGRLPYPMECSINKESPVSQIFNGREIKITKNFPDCVDCQRNVEWIPWKRGDWAKIIDAIKRGEDLTDMDAPYQGDKK